MQMIFKKIWKVKFNINQFIIKYYIIISLHKCKFNFLIISNLKEHSIKINLADILIIFCLNMKNIKLKNKIN